jgi:endonuclease/exonuclease/phosphatase (EEP) superfamily protein YafD
MAATSVFAIAMVAWNILRLYPGDRWLPVRLGNFVAPWLFFVLLVALAAAWLGRRPWLSRLLALLVLVSVLRFWPVLTPRLSGPNAQANAPVGQLRVMTFNVHFSNRDALGIADLVRAETPDIVAFQECTMDLITPLYAGLGGEYPYFLLDDGETPRLVLMSRYPLQGYVPPPGAWRTQWAQVETPLGLVTVWNVHSSSSLSQRAWEWQRETFSAVANQVGGEEGPVLVLGDLNRSYLHERSLGAAGNARGHRRCWFRSPAGGGYPALALLIDPSQCVVTRLTCFWSWHFSLWRWQCTMPR